MLGDWEIELCARRLGTRFFFFEVGKSNCIKGGLEIEFYTWGLENRILYVCEKSSFFIGG